MLLSQIEDARLKSSSRFKNDAYKPILVNQQNSGISKKENISLDGIAIVEPENLSILKIR